MSYETKFPDWDQKIKDAANTTQSASAAAAKLGIKYDTYKKYALKYGCFVKNQAGKGTNKISGIKYPIEDILSGKYPEYQTNKLRKRLINESILEERCSSCGLTQWLGNKMPLELDHINGICTDHNLDNLRLLCPNCHAFTSTYRGKNTIKAKFNKV